MPHYKDGSEAKVGDQVVGKLYNSGPELKAGVIISITLGVESCNAMVQFTEARPLEDEIKLPEAPRMAVFAERSASASSSPNDAPRAALTRFIKGEQHGSSGPRFVLFTCADYCATNELTKVG
jgi:hypothetical protein